MTSDDTAQYEDSEVPIDDLLRTLALIEEQALSSRAPSYGEVQEQLRARLEGADVRR